MPSNQPHVAAIVSLPLLHLPLLGSALLLSHIDSRLVCPDMTSKNETKPNSDLGEIAARSNESVRTASSQESSPSSISLGFLLELHFILILESHLQ
jgi:hypothetical protein